VVNVVDMAKNVITDTVDLGGAPTQMTLSADTNRAYVVDYDRVMVLCTLTHEVVSSISVSARPSCVAVDSEGGRLHVADYAGGVNVFSVPSTMSTSYSQFMATDPICARELRALEAATA
jgi:DNA-binding beta-propeller fold protein YncE